MRVPTMIALCIALIVGHAQPAGAGERAQGGSLASAQSQQVPGDELHFVSVLTLKGEIVKIEPAKRLVTLKGPNGEVLSLEAKNEGELATRRVGDRVVVRYFEGAQIGGKEKHGAASSHSLKEGILGAESGTSAEKKTGLIASVEHVDMANQEITLKGPDGSLETIMVSDPAYLHKVKVGDRVVIMHSQALALSLQSET
jgi:hypothetical protein